MQADGLPCDTLAGAENSHSELPQDTFSMPPPLVESQEDKIRRVVEFQFDLELLTKQRELVVIQRRLDTLHRILQDPSQLHDHIRQQKADREKSQFLFARSADGGYVRLGCPVCGRDRFINKLGFVNHCRIVHSLKFATYNDAALYCGQSVPETEVPPDDPCRTQTYFPKQRQGPSLMSPPAKRSAHSPPASPANSEMHSDAQEEEDGEDGEGELSRLEDVSLESSFREMEEEMGREEGDLRGSEGTRSANGNGHGKGLPAAQEDDEGMVVDEERSAQVTPVPTSTPTPAPEPVDEHAYLRFTPAPPIPADNHSRFYVHKQVIVGNTCEKIIHPKGSEEDSTHKWLVYVRGPAEEPDVSYFIKKVRMFLHQSYAPNHVVELTRAPFQLRRRGWGEFPVRVQLHFKDAARNRPVDVIHVLKLHDTPMQMLGAETPVDIQLDRRGYNPPAPLPAPVTSPSPLSSPPPSSPHPNGITPFTSPSPTVSTIIPTPPPSSNGFIIKPDPYPLTQSSPSPSSSSLPSSCPSLVTVPLHLPPSIHPSLARHLSAFATLDSEKMRAVMSETLRLYPLISDRKVRFTPYMVAPTQEAYYQWNIGRQRASEWSRARCMRRHVAERARLDLPTKTYVLWCLHHKHTPPRPSPMCIIDPNLVDESPLSHVSRLVMPPQAANPRYVALFCRYCGCTHDRLTFATAQHQCAKQLKALRLNSATPREKRSSASHADSPASLAPDLLEALEEENCEPELEWVAQSLHLISEKLSLRPADPAAVNLMKSLAAVFIRSLAEGTRDVCVAQHIADPTQPPTRVLVPMHLYQHVVANPSLAFLTRADLGKKN